MTLHVLDTDTLSLLQRGHPLSYNDVLQSRQLNWPLL